MKILSVVLLILIIGIKLLTVHSYHISLFFSEEQLGSYINTIGFFGPLVFIAIMAISVIISPIPSMPLAVIAGGVWGSIVGTLYSVLGAEIGAIVAFLIARYAGRTFLVRVFSKSKFLSFNCNERYLFWVVLLTRLFPFFQFDFVSYGAGLTNMKVSTFALATFIGMIPMTYVFTRFGTSILSGNSTLMISSTLLIIIGLFVVPALMEKYNLFNLKGKIIAK